MGIIGCWYNLFLIFIRNLSVVVGEANLFEEALQKYGKDFSDIQKDFVSNKIGFSHPSALFFYF